jgi:hypothetical protein
MHVETFVNNDKRISNLVYECTPTDRRNVGRRRKNVQSNTHEGGTSLSVSYPVADDGTSYLSEKVTLTQQFSCPWRAAIITKCPLSSLRTSASFVSSSQPFPLSRRWNSFRSKLHLALRHKTPQMPHSTKIGVLRSNCLIRPVHQT